MTHADHTTGATTGGWAWPLNASSKGRNRVVGFFEVRQVQNFREGVVVDA